MNTIFNWVIPTAIYRIENKEQKKKMPKKKDEMEILAEKLHKETLKMHKKFLNNNK